MALHPDEHHQSFQNLRMALESEIDSHYQGIYLGDSEDGDVNLQLYYPMLVLQGQLLTARIVDGDFQLRPTDHVLFRLEHNSSGREATYLVDLVTEGYLPTLMDQEEEEVKRIRYRMLRNKTRVRRSVEALVAKSKGHADRSGVRASIDWDSQR
jgi:hypothetical protein